MSVLPFITDVNEAKLVRMHVHLFNRSFVRSFGRSVGRSFVRSFDRSFVRSIVRSFVRSIRRSFVRSFSAVRLFVVTASVWSTCFVHSYKLVIERTTNCTNGHTDTH